MKLTLLLTLTLMTTSAVAQFFTTEEDRTKQGIPKFIQKGARVITREVNPPMRLLFSENKTEIEDFKTIRTLGRALEDKRLRDTVMIIEGHADPSENEPEKLALERAKAVAADLKAHFDIAARELLVQGKGATLPLVAVSGEPDPNARTNNRRVIVYRQWKPMGP